MLGMHRHILADKVRNAAFAKALKKVIVPGKSVVADIGSGTGFLGFVAAKLGAKHCYLIERNGDAVELSRRLAEENGIVNCTFLRGESEMIDLPEKVDIIVSETLGNFLYEENMIETLEDAKRFLKPDGMIIPQSVTSFILPVINPRHHRAVNVWDGIGHGLGFTEAKKLSLSKMHSGQFSVKDLLPMKQARQWDSADFLKKNLSIRGAEMEWTLLKTQTIYGFAVWWDAVLAPGIELSTSPLAPRTHWGQVFLPLLEPLTVGKGNTLQLSFTSDSCYRDGVHLSWDSQVMDKKGKVVAEQAMDTRHSLIKV